MTKANAPPTPVFAIRLQDEVSKRTVVVNFSESTRVKQPETSESDIPIVVQVCERIPCIPCACACARAFACACTRSTVERRRCSTARLVQCMSLHHARARRRSLQTFLTFFPHCCNNLSHNYCCGPSPLPPRPPPRPLLFVLSYF